MRHGTSGAIGQIESLKSSAAKGEGASFVASWTSSSSGTVTKITLAHEGTKDYFATSSTFIVATSNQTYYCTTSAMTCVKEAGMDPLAGLLGLYDGSTFVDTAKVYTDQAILEAEGVSLNFSSGTYGGVASKCVKISKNASTATWCVGTSSGILTYWLANSDSFTLTSYSSTPPAADFSVPAGYTTTSIP
jgi:hypothetical protein